MVLWTVSLPYLSCSLINLLTILRLVVIVRIPLGYLANELSLWMNAKSLLVNSVMLASVCIGLASSYVVAHGLPTLACVTLP